MTARSSFTWFRIARGPLDFEVYQVTEVVGHGVGADSEQEFLPFYTAYSSDEAAPSHAYFTTGASSGC
jgi:type VI protein secretion system component VasA